MRGTAFRLCEADSLTSGGLTRVLASTHDPCGSTASNAPRESESNGGGGAIMLAGQGGLRLWDLDTNMARCFILFSIRYVAASEYASSSGSGSSGDLLAATPKPVTAAVSRICLLSETPTSPASHVAFTLCQHSAVFVAQIPRLQHPQDEDDEDASNWLMKGSAVYKLPTSSQASNTSQPNARGQNTCIEKFTAPRHNLVASGTEVGQVTLWALPHRLRCVTSDRSSNGHSDIDTDETSASCLGTAQAFAGTPVTSICFVSSTKVLVAGTEPSIHIFTLPNIPSVVNSDSSCVAQLRKTNTIHTGLPSIRCMASLATSPNRHLVSCGFGGDDSGAVLAWDINTTPMRGAKQGEPQVADASEETLRRMGGEQEGTRIKLDGAFLTDAQSAITCVNFAVSHDGLPLIVVSQSVVGVAFSSRPHDVHRQQLSGSKKSKSGRFVLPVVDL
jgi:hypothetical protein